MKIALLNTYAHGGAGTAALRLTESLHSIGQSAQLLVRSGEASNFIQPVDNQRLAQLPFYAERLSFLPFEHDRSVRFQFSPANFGLDLRSHPLIRAADVIHLHWINQGFLSLKNVAQLAQLNKPIVWTLHDMWAFTGGCHYSRGCNHFMNDCGNCLYLNKPYAHDLSNQIIEKKKKLFSPNIQFITCSDWLKKIAESSSLLKNYSIQSIPNPINTDVFKPLTADERATARAKLGIAPEKKVLLFVAMKVSEKRKGFAFLQTALEKLKTQLVDNQLDIIVLGQAEADSLAALPYPTRPQGLVRGAENLRVLYGLADAFVIPSLEDNLPNTIMESLACGTPVVGFETGGIPEMVAHEINGFIAPQHDSIKLAEGINWVISDKNRLENLRLAARNTALENYSYTVVANRFLRVYQQLLQ